MGFDGLRSQGALALLARPGQGLPTIFFKILNTCYKTHTYGTQHAYVLDLFS